MVKLQRLAKASGLSTRAKAPSATRCDGAAARRERCVAATNFWTKPLRHYPCRRREGHRSLEGWPEIRPKLHRASQGNRPNQACPKTQRYGQSTPSSPLHLIRTLDEGH